MLTHGRSTNRKNKAKADGEREEERKRSELLCGSLPCFCPYYLRLHRLASCGQQSRIAQLRKTIERLPSELRVTQHCVLHNTLYERAVNLAQRAVCATPWG